MKPLKLVLVLLVVCSTVQAQQTPKSERLYDPATLAGTLRLIANARRSIWLIAPKLGNLEIVRALATRANAGIPVRLVLTNARGIDQNALALSKRTNIDARWLPQQLSASALVIDDLHLVLGSLLSGVAQPNNLPSMEIRNRPEVAGSMRQRISLIFEHSRRIQ
jgi:phosphatidylserine/phosphatidylglycerophosphate/cardiolipin synthase-like enzyme